MEAVNKDIKSKEIHLTDNCDHNILRLFDLPNFTRFTKFYQIFFSPQWKPCAIISNKHGLYKLTHKFPNNLIKA